ncbi:kinase-like domain-containing protein [Mycotypha africana]|uniref:kinase-like domain-containing protein n=1 Tax=Mycotypha africana TaxID=64632 RepID=UPI002301EF6F|nr:kinase-like domain-containing protein [Mycotypha africana]KAI8991642.1 kinase-like domain-containing protein [Mycotypha africana]
MARCFDEADNLSYLTQYVTTRWYRAPEVMISLKNYSKASMSFLCIPFICLSYCCYTLTFHSFRLVDIWSVGCILAEILGRKVLFQGKDHVDQLYKILGVLGVPSDISFWNPSEYIVNHIQQLRTINGSPPPTETIDFHTLFPNASSDAGHLLKHLLELDPSKRLTVEKALSHPFVQPFSDPAEESLIPPCYPRSHYDFELCQDDDELKDMIINEIVSFKNYHQEREAKLMNNNKFIDSSNLFHFHPHPSQNSKRHHTVSSVEIDYYSPTPTQKLDYLPSATMSLLEPSSPFMPSSISQEYNSNIGENNNDYTAATTNGSNGAFMCNEDTFVGEPEELDEDDRHSYLEELTKTTPGVKIIDSDRMLHELVEEKARRTLERALSGMAQKGDNI